VHEFYDAILALGCDAGMLAQRHPGVMKAGLLLLCAMAEADPDYASAVEAAFLPRLKEMTRLRLVTDEEEA
jgi:hypothetical protein